jgi:hypothetical protein
MVAASTGHPAATKRLKLRGHCYFNVVTKINLKLNGIRKGDSGRWRAMLWADNSGKSSKRSLSSSVNQSTRNRLIIARKRAHS